MKMKWFPYLMVVLVSVFLILVALVVVPDRRTTSQEETPAETVTAALPESTAEPETETEPESEEETLETDTEEPPTEESAEEPTTEEPTTEAPTESAEVGLVSVNEVAFIGDSRTVFLGSSTVGNVTGTGLIPDSVLFAKYGGRLTDAEMKTLAQNAASSGAKKVVIWMGVNDVQTNPNRNSALEFIANFQNVLNEYLKVNRTKEVYILSVLTTSVEEKDYYEEQEENIRKYNAELTAYAERQGFHYIDLSTVFRGEADFLSDGIHFTRAFYERLVPFLKNAVGFY